MKTFKSIAAGLYLGLATVGMSAGSANAGLLHNLSTSFGSGSIEFNALMGSDTSGVVNFNFDVVMGENGGPQNYTKADIDTIVWNIDPDWSLGVTLETNTKIFRGGISGIRLSNETTTSMDHPCRPFSTAPFYSATCEMSSGITGISIDARPMIVIPVPEPGTLALFGLGLAGLGIARRRKQAA